MKYVFTEEQLRVTNKIHYYEFCQLRGWLYSKKSYIEKDEYEQLKLLRDSWNLSIDELNDLSKQVHNIAVRKSRLRSRIEYMLLHFDCAFVTFTLNNEHVNYNLKLLRTMICRLLKELNCYYVGNIDFGSEKERLHFHFIISRSDCKKFLKLRYASSEGLNYGFIDFRKITQKNQYKLSSYIDKLNNHALKASTMQVRRASIITSRGDYAFNKLDL